MAAPTPSPYHLKLLEARRAFEAGPRADVLKALARELADVLAWLGSEVGQGALGSDHAAAVMAGLRRTLARVADRLATVLDAEALAALELAARYAEDATAALVRPVAPQLVTQVTFASVPELAVEGLFVRRGLQQTTYRALLRRGAARSMPTFETMIVRAVATGQTGESLAADLATALGRVDPLVRKAAARATSPYGRLMKRRLLAEAASEVNPEALTAARRLWYEARRIAVTEMNVAHAEGSRAAAVRSPVVDLLRWRVSGRHDGLLTSPDVCDYYRFANLHGYGVGLYHPGAFPALPHPHCACHGAHVLRPVERWGGEARPLPEHLGDIDAQVRRKAEAAGQRAMSDAEWERESAKGHVGARLAVRMARAEDGAAGLVVPLPGGGYNAAPFNKGRPRGMPRVQMDMLSEDHLPMLRHYETLTTRFPWAEYEKDAAGIWRHPSAPRKSEDDLLVERLLVGEGKRLVSLPENFTGQLEGVQPPDFEVDGMIGQGKVRRPVTGDPMKKTLHIMRAERRAGPHMVLVFDSGAEVDVVKLREQAGRVFALDNILHAVSVYRIEPDGSVRLLFRADR